MAIVIVVGGDGGHAEEVSGDVGLLGYVGEMAFAVVAVEVVGEGSLRGLAEGVGM